MKSGIVGYGTYVPNGRISSEDIWNVWMFGLGPRVIKAARGLSERAVARWDEDPITMAGDASKIALQSAGVAASQIEAMYFGSGTNPYVTRPSCSVVAEIIGTGPEIFCADCQFAGKSGTAAMQVCLGLAEAGLIRYGLAIGSDAFSRHVAPNDTLEYSASYGAAALIIGREGVIAEVEDTCSYTTHTPDLFRLDGDRYVKHSLNPDEEIAVGYRKHTVLASQALLKKVGRKPEDYNYAIFSQPDGRGPVRIGKEIGFREEQIEPGLVSRDIGDCSSASPLISLAAVLDQAKAGERIFLTSYGYGAGSDAFSIKTTNLIEKTKPTNSVKDQIARKTYLNYSEYLKSERKIMMEYV